MTSQSWRRQSGFTAVELLTAVFITMVMLVMINQIFHDTTEAVATGINLKDAVANARSFGDLLEREFHPRRFVGPGEASGNGFLVILGKEYGNVTMFRPGGGEYTRTVRSDQLAFFIHEDGGSSLRSLTPGYDDAYTNPVTATRARVWYGHLQKLKPDGTVDGALGSGQNFLGTRWVLGHQLLLLAGDDVTRKGIAANHFLSPPYADANFQTKLVSGRFDVCSGTLDGPVNAITGPNDAFPPPFILSTDDAATYKAKAYLFTFAGQRLRTNAAPSGYSANEVAPMHAFFMAGCSDFIVEFAANTNTLNDNPNLLHQGPDRDTNGNIIWYGLHNVPTWTGYDVTKGDPTVNTATTNANVGWVWRHDYAENWPMLIRIRYRLHDKDGQLVDRNEESGIWFEHIVDLNRAL